MHTTTTFSLFSAGLAAYAFALSLAVTSAQSASPSPSPAAAAGGAATTAPRFDMEVRADFFAGFTGDRARLERGLARTAAVLAASPDHAEALVWHGSGVMFQSGQAFQTGDAATGMRLMNEGLDEMSRAVALASDHVGVRVPRGATLLEYTRFMPSAQAEPLVRLAVSDYERVLELQAARFASLGGHARGELLFGLADGYARLGDPQKARHFFERMAAEGGPSPRRDYAAAWLQGQAPARVPACSGCH